MPGRLSLEVSQGGSDILHCRGDTLRTQTKDVPGFLSVNWCVLKATEMFLLDLRNPKKLRGAHGFSVEQPGGSCVCDPEMEGQC